MNRVIRIGKSLRNHWKKSTFAALCLAYGIDYGKSKYEMFQMMRAYCEEAKAFGEFSIGNVVKPRHLTVILNPAAKNNKGVPLYEKFAAPLFHLAGIRISLIKTEYEGQAKQLMEVMDNTDAVVIAGGDGTLCEAVTGLCKREDANSATIRFPLGVIPIGKTNTVAKYLFWNDHALECRLLAETAMAIIKGTTKQLDVMSVASEDGKQVFALSSMEWGRFRDVKAKIPQYWYWGFLQSKVAYLFAALKKQSESMEAKLLYTLPCEGCSKCYLDKYMINSQPATTFVVTRRWWHSLIPRQNQQSSGPVGKDFSKILNDFCGIWHEKDIKTVDLSIETSNNRPGCQDSKTSLKINVGPETIGSLDFIKQGWQIDHTNYSVTKNEHKDIEVIYADAVKLKTNFLEENEMWYSIDNDNFEAKPINIQLIPRKINVFCK